MPPEFPPYQLSPPSLMERIKHAWSIWLYTPSAPAIVGQQAPWFLLTDPRSKITEANNNYLGKTLVLKFCATWCVPCQWELMDWIKFHKQYWRENLVIIGVYLDFESNLLVYARQNKIPYTCCTATSKILWDYGIYPEGKLPRTCIIERSGKIAWQENSYHTGATYESKFKPLLGPK